MQSGMFGLSGENLTKRLRSLAFKAMLSQDVAFFDKQENNVGILCTKLATETSAVQGVCLRDLEFLQISLERNSQQIRIIRTTY